MTARRVTSLVVLAVLVAQLNCLAPDARAQQPPVEYQITPIPVANGAYAAPRDINNLSIVVGSHQPNGYETGYVYDHRGLIGAPQTVHSLEEWIDLDGWSRAVCMGVNDLGQVVGLLEGTIDGQTERKGFYLDLDILSESPVPTWEYLPSPPASTYFYGRKINNNGGVIVPFRQNDGTYRAYLFNPSKYDPTNPATDYEILTDPGTGAQLSLQLGWVTLNDSRQVVGMLSDDTCFRLTPGVALEPLPITSSYSAAINNSGMVSSTLRVSDGKRKRPTITEFAVRVSAAGDSEVINDNSQSHDINESGDVVGMELNERWTPFVYHSDVNGNAGYGLFYLDDVVTGSANDLEFWFSSNAEQYRVNDRDGTDFGQITVQASRKIVTGKGKNRTEVWERRVFLFTPVRP